MVRRYPRSVKRCAPGHAHQSSEPCHATGFSPGLIFSIGRFADDLAIWHIVTGALPAARETAVLDHGSAGTRDGAAGVSCPRPTTCVRRDGGTRPGADGFDSAAPAGLRPSDSDHHRPQNGYLWDNPDDN